MGVPQIQHFQRSRTRVENLISAVVSSRPVDLSPVIEQIPDRRTRPLLPDSQAWVLLCVVVVLIAAGLIVYSQTVGFVWDEGFHLLAAQLINRGKTLYIDFCFPQTPLNTYWNAFWMQIFGETWRVPHVLAALATAGTVFLAMEFVFRRFPVPRWRFACALVTAFFVGLNGVVVQFATCAQAYGIGMFLSIAAFRVSIAGVARKSWLYTLCAGLLAGAAAGCSLLTAPVAPVLLIWIALHNRSGNRWAKIGSFVAGIMIPFAPVFWLFAKAPRQVMFNIVQYQAMYRRVKWNGATPHDFDVLSAWLDSTPALFMGLLAIAGVWFLAKRSNWDRERRNELSLCLWLSIALIAYIAIAHPTFQRYFVFAVPFVSALAAVGLYAVGLRLADPDRPFLPTFALSVLLILSLARALFNDRDAVNWHDYEEIARKVDKVTPRNAELYADELVYFLTKRPPPPGMEFSYAHKLELPPAQEALYHIVSERELNEQVKAGKFYTVQSCNDDRIDEMDLADLFPHKADVKDCTVFWGKVKTPPKKAGK